MKKNYEKLVSGDLRQGSLFNELHERLSNTRGPMAFFFGAGISMEAKVPNLVKMTENIEQKI